MMFKRLVIFLLPISISYADFAQLESAFDLKINDSQFKEIISSNSDWFGLKLDPHEQFQQEFWLVPYYQMPNANVVTDSSELTNILKS
ncbi:hypothetical protein A3F66_05090 [candidate division TM6 bacterium RIFCSPHIGHO2_12_FULL_32_22]|nr:MAG: hypothetical protein A3F66_05090 [candidate division TM6 bacterium RIFCSPHIGHO2_12_FULL_32_22]